MLEIIITALAAAAAAAGGTAYRLREPGESAAALVRRILSGPRPTTPR
jgi:hypothetical protein